MDGLLKPLFQETVNEYFLAWSHIFSWLCGCRFYNIMLQNVCVSDFNSAAIGFSFSQQSNSAKIQIANTTTENVVSNCGPLVDVSYSSSNTNRSKVFK